MAEVDRNELLFWETDDVSDWRLLVVLEVVEDLVVVGFERNIIDMESGGMVTMRVVKMWRENKPERSSCDP